MRRGVKDKEPLPRLERALRGVLYRLLWALAAFEEVSEIKP